MVESISFYVSFCYHHSENNLDFPLLLLRPCDSSSQISDLFSNLFHTQHIFFVFTFTFLTALFYLSALISHYTSASEYSFSFFLTSFFQNPVLQESYFQNHYVFLPCSIKYFLKTHLFHCSFGLTSLTS